MIAFALGLLALAALLRRRLRLTVALIACAVVMHLTTALWWAVVLAVAAAVLDVRARRLLAFAVPAVLVVALLAAAGGVLGAPLVRMDAAWLAAVASKDSLSPSDWPLWAWAANLALPAVLWMAHRAGARGDASAEDRAVVWGGLALAGIFLATLPLVLARFALPTQFQISRVFWLIDFLAVLYVLALLMPPGAVRRARLVAAVLVLASVAPGAYVTFVEFPDRCGPHASPIRTGTKRWRGSRRSRPTCTSWPTPGMRGSTARACGRAPGATRSWKTRRTRQWRSIRETWRSACTSGPRRAATSTG
jgi:hypothetical protein